MIAGFLLVVVQGDVFEAPLRIQAAGRPIDVDLGHAAPVFRDFDGDGLADLLVGQFGGGRLSIHKNIGRKGQPEFAEGVWFEAGGSQARIPSG